MGANSCGASLTVIHISAHVVGAAEVCGVGDSVCVGCGVRCLFSQNDSYTARMRYGAVTQSWPEARRSKGWRRRWSNGWRRGARTARLTWLVVMPCGLVRRLLFLFLFLFRSCISWQVGEATVRQERPWGQPGPRRRLRAVMAASVLMCYELGVCRCVRVSTDTTRVG